MFTKDVYSYPEYCEIAYNWDRSLEYDFIEECIGRYSTIRVKAILDIACGPGIHLREFAKRGYKVLGLDKSKEMVEFVNKKARLEGLSFRCVQADMKDFRLDDNPAPSCFGASLRPALLNKRARLRSRKGRGKYECAICMLDSFRYLLTDDDILSHFNSLAKALEVGGLYILDFWMPKNESRTCTQGQDEDVIEWKDAHWVERDKDITIDATYRQLAHTFNPKDKTFEDELIFKIRGPRFNATINGRARTRLLYLSEFKRLIRDSGAFDYIGRFYNFDFDLKEDYNIKLIRTIIILRRKGEEKTRCKPNLLNLE